MIKLALSIWMLFRVQYPSKAHDTRDMGTESSYKHIKTILQEKEHTFFFQMCLTFPILTGCAWEPGSGFLRFVEV